MQALQATQLRPWRAGSVPKVTLFRSSSRAQIRFVAGLMPADEPRRLSRSPVKERRSPEEEPGCDSRFVTTSCQDALPLEQWESLTMRRSASPYCCLNYPRAEGE